MASVNQTRPHFVNQMGKTHSKPLATRHGTGTAWARHAMWKSPFMLPSVRTETSPKEPTTNLSILYVLEARLPRCLLEPYLCHGVEPYDFQVRHPRCVDRITSIDKCSQIQLSIFVLLRGVSTWLVITATCFGRYIGHHQFVHSLIFKAKYTIYERKSENKVLYFIAIK
jgi:hypothetical protein